MSNTVSEHKAALFLANGFETIEALTVADVGSLRVFDTPDPQKADKALFF